MPEPGEAPAIAEQDIDPPGLAAFFRKALDRGMTYERPFATEGELWDVGRSWRIPPTSVILPLNPKERRAAEPRVAADRAAPGR